MIRYQYEFIKRKVNNEKYTVNANLVHDMVERLVEFDTIVNTCDDLNGRKVCKNFTNLGRKKHKTFQKYNIYTFQHKQKQLYEHTIEVKDTFRAIYSKRREDRIINAALHKC